MFHKAYIDADSMIWRAGAVTEAEQPSHCFHIIKGWINEVPAKEKIVVLSNKDKSVNSRYEIAQTVPYKGNRKQSQFKHHDAARQYLIDHWDAVVVDRQEADDYVSAMAYQHGGLIASIDKDLKNTPGTHYNWVNGETQTISHGVANLNFYRQCLSGDATDNIKGLTELTKSCHVFADDARGLKKACGEKTAEKLLHSVSSEKYLCYVVLICYLSYAFQTFDKEIKDGDFTIEEVHCMGLMHFLENARLLWMEREWGEGYKVPKELGIDLRVRSRMLTTDFDLSQPGMTNLRGYIDAMGL